MSSILFLNCSQGSLYYFVWAWTEYNMAIFLKTQKCLKIYSVLGRLGGTAVKRLPSAQGVIPALWDRAPRQVEVPVMFCEVEIYF